MSIPVFSATVATDDIADALGEAGCVVVTGVFDESARMRVRQELSPYMERVPVEEDDPAEFYAGLTRRTSALVARSETCLLYTSPSPRDLSTSRMPSSA